MRVRGATAFHFDMARLKRPLLPCNCGSQTQLSKSEWGQMPPTTPHPHTHTSFTLFSCLRSLHLGGLDLSCGLNKQRLRPPAEKDMLLIEFLLVICSFQVSKKKNRKLQPHLLRPWEGVKCHSCWQRAKEKEASESHLIHREGSEKRGA